jgi:hypothetical protein
MKAFTLLSTRTKIDPVPNATRMTAVPYYSLWPLAGALLEEESRPLGPIAGDVAGSIIPALAALWVLRSARPRAIPPTRFSTDQSSLPARQVYFFSGIVHMWAVCFAPVSVLSTTIVARVGM